MFEFGAVQRCLARNVFHGFQIGFQRCRSWNPNEKKPWGKKPRTSQRRSAQTLDAYAEKMRKSLMLQRNIIPAQKPPQKHKCANLVYFEKMLQNEHCLQKSVFDRAETELRQVCCMMRAREPWSGILSDLGGDVLQLQHRLLRRPGLSRALEETHCVAGWRCSSINSCSFILILQKVKVSK